MKENVLVISRENLPNKWIQGRFAEKISVEEFKKDVSIYSWMDRDIAEIDESVKQLIPYIILKDKVNNRIGVYQRHGSEKRIHGLHSVGVGGHISDTDNREAYSMFDIIIHSAKRELSEELIGLDTKEALQFIGVMNEEETKVGRTHIALVFVIELEKLPIGDQELLNFEWKNKEDIILNYKLELWSEMALSIA
jgi:predicted NUDIX family phosphoesterase